VPVSGPPCPYYTQMPFTFSDVFHFRCASAVTVHGWVSVNQWHEGPDGQCQNFFFVHVFIKPNFEAEIRKTINSGVIYSRTLGNDPKKLNDKSYRLCGRNNLSMIAVI
jgi:hypothetical protein